MKMLMLKVVSLNALLATAALCISCNPGNFRGGGNRGEPPAPAPAQPPPPVIPGLQVVKLACEGENPSTNSFSSIQGKSSDSLRIEGEFCPSVFGEMSILFVVDISGSMGPTSTGPGNDPGTLGGCGRLQSAQAIIQRITQKLRPQDKVTAGVVTFSTSARVAVPMGPIAGFQGSLNALNFCGQSGATNYAQAFQTAQQALTGATGSKTIYFISDGQPQVTSADRDPQAETDGLNAAQALKTAIPDATLNAIFLQPTGGVDPSFNPQAYLAQITGSPDRVRLAANAGALADEILKFAFPELDVVESSAKGILRIESSGTLGAVELEKFERNPAKKGVWSYATKPFKPQGKTGVEVVNQVSIVAQDKVGKEQTANVVINFKQLD